MKATGDKGEAEEYTEDDLESYFNLNITLLSLISIFVGLNGNRNFEKFGVLTRIPILTLVTVTFSVTVAILQIFWISRIWSTDMETVTLIYTNIFSNLSCVSKGVCLVRNKRNLQLLLDKVSKMWNDNGPKGECRKKILRRAKKTVKFIKIYIFMTIGLIIAFGFPPLQYMLSQYLSRESLNYTYDYSLRLFIIKYPFNIDSPLTYWPVICEEFWILFGLALCWVSSDTLFASLTTQLTIQFEILEDDINSKIKHEPNEKNLKSNLIILVHRHRTILSASKEVQQIFSPIVFLNVVVSSMIICVNTFVVQQKLTTGAYSQAGYHLFLMFNTLLQIIVYCVFAETLTQTSLSISKAIYNCAWETKSRDIRVCIHILLMKTQKPFYCSAYGFFTLSHQQLTKIVNTAVSYYMMLQTTSQ